MIKKIELIDSLIGKSHGYNRSKLQSLPKKQLEDLYSEYELGDIDMGKIEVQEIEIEIEEENKVILKDKDGEIGPDIPDRNSKEWTSYVISLLEEGVEKYKGIPSCDGLRRIFLNLIGEIISCDVEVVSAPGEGDSRYSATVICRIIYIDHFSKIQKLIADVFDINSTNTKFPFYLAPCATASTKAEARCLRKALGLIKVLSQEEILQGFDQDEGISKTSNIDTENPPLAETAKITIRNLSNKFNISITKLMKYMEIKAEGLDSLDKSSGLQLVRQLNEYGSMSEIPEEIKEKLESL